MLIFCLCQTKYVNLTMVYLVYHLRGFMSSKFFFENERRVFFLFFIEKKTYGSLLGF